MQKIQPQKLYNANDMAKIGCRDCAGCSSCCRDMGESIWLDPYDVFQLTTNLGKRMEELLENEAELHVEDGLILPNIRMHGENESKCSFLNEEGRCDIHAFRPGFCRLFPLGRNYEEGKLSYFVLSDACNAPIKTKVKINKWINVPKFKDYEAFLEKWHGLTKGLREFYADNQGEDAVIKTINMKFLQIFYLTSYEQTDFYGQFEVRFTQMMEFLQILGVYI